MRNNRRRVYLINKELNVGLSAPEAAELARIQDSMDRHLDAVAPLPQEALSEFEERARQVLGVNP